jgi:putative Mg2+ transporter-C (MgtC) family protein
VLDLSIGWEQTVVRLVAAAALGGAIGLERELDDKSAGLRTHMLVATGSALFTLVGAYGFSAFFAHGKVVSFDPSRVAAQIVTGIGFLVAGVIFRQGFTVRGLTTAASLWIVAAVGMAAGAGFWAGAVLATVIGIVSLRPLGWIKDFFIPQRAETVLMLDLARNASSGPVLEAVERSGEVRAMRREGGHVELELQVARDRRAALLAAVAALDEVKEARWQS